MPPPSGLAVALLFLLAFLLNPTESSFRSYASLRLRSPAPPPCAHNICLHPSGRFAPAFSLPAALTSALPRALGISGLRVEITDSATEPLHFEGRSYWLFTHVRLSRPPEAPAWREKGERVVREMVAAVGGGGGGLHPGVAVDFVGVLNCWVPMPQLSIIVPAVFKTLRAKLHFSTAALGRMRGAGGGGPWVKRSYERLRAYERLRDDLLPGRPIELVSTVYILGLLATVMFPRIVASHAVLSLSNIRERRLTCLWLAHGLHTSVMHLAKDLLFLHTVGPRVLAYVGKSNFYGIVLCGAGVGSALSLLQQAKGDWGVERFRLGWRGSSAFVYAILTTACLTLASSKSIPLRAPILYDAFGDAAGWEAAGAESAGKAWKMKPFEAMLANVALDFFLSNISPTGSIDHAINAGGALGAWLYCELAM